MRQYTFLNSKHPHYGFDTYYVVVAGSLDTAVDVLMKQLGKLFDEDIRRMYISEESFTGVIEYVKPWEVS